MDLDEFKRYFDTKFNELNKKVNDSRQKAPLSVKKKGNQAQYDHALQVFNFIANAEDELKEDNKEAATNKLKSAKKSAIEKD